MKRGDRSYFMISSVAQTYGIHPQTLRLYEREGLLKPSRTVGNTRVYTQEDIRQLEVILSLTRDLGVNLAGVEIILNMRKKMESMQAEINEFLSGIGKEMQDAEHHVEERPKHALMRIPQAKLVRIQPPVADEIDSAKGLAARRAKAREERKISGGPEDKGDR